MTISLPARDGFSSRDTIPTICLLKWGGLGSVITTRPLLLALRGHFGPSIRIIYITSRANAVLIDRMGLVDEIFEIEPTGFPAQAVLVLLRKLRAQGLATFFDLQIHTHRRLAAIVARLSGAPQRFSFFRPRERPPQDHVGIYANPFAPLDRLYLEMAHQVGATLPESARWSPGLAITQADHTEAAALLKGWLSTTDKLLIINPNASATAFVRRWPVSCYAEASLMLLRAIPDLKIALVGAKSEAAYVNTLHHALLSHGDRVRNLAGQTSLGGLLALLRRADCLLSNDSGPLHLGLLLDVPVVGLFGPVHPDHNAQLGRPQRKIILYQPVLCSPCVHQVDTPPCDGDNLCMQLLAPENVAAACRSLIFAETEAARKGVQTWQFTHHQGKDVVAAG